MNSLRVLIVDDDPGNLRLLRARIESQGPSVLEASNGQDALAILAAEPVDVVISDTVMPVMDGYRLCREIRSSERLRHLAFLISTAIDTSPSDEKLGFDAGADGWLRLPAPTGEIARAIGDALARPRRQPTPEVEPPEVLQPYSERLVNALENRNIELTEAVSQLTLRTTALEMAADAIVITDRDGTILWVNRAFTTNTGFTAREALGKTPRILKSGVHGEAFYRAFWGTILGGKTWRGEFTNRRKDGSISHDIHTVTPVRSPSGAITHFVGVMHDITARKVAEERLRDAHEQLRQILDHSPAVLYALKFEAEVVVPRLVSENITRLLGFEVEETLRSGWWQEQLLPEDRERAEASVAETFEHGSSCTEYRLRHKDGSLRWVEDNRRLVRDREGKPLELVGVWTDVTGRKRTEDELHESERRFREMLNNLELVAMMLDRDARITYCNDYLLRVTGWRRDEVLGRDWLEQFIPPEQAGELRTLFESLVRDDPVAWHHANEILTRSGERRLLQWNNTVLRSASGDVIGTASVAEDVTDRKALEKQILKAQRLESLGTLAGGIAHDLNNVLMPILMGVTLVKRLEPDPRSQKVLDNIERAVKRGRELVNQVLLFARGAEGVRESLNLADIVSEVEAIAVSMFPANIRFHVSVAEDLRAIMGDPTKLTQVLLNLCVNARDAMPRGGVISISVENVQLTDPFARAHGARSDGPFVLLTVADTGEGIPEDVVERIFDPFFTTKEPGKGTGLGLATVQGIVNGYGGFISVSSKPGQGSTFQVYIPAGPAEPEAIAEVAGVSHPPEGNGELILLVDDDASVLGITRQTLETFGYQVMTAEDGAQAIGVFSYRHAEIDLVVSDMAVPVIDGPALMAALFRIDPAVPVVAITGSTSAAYLTEIANAGAGIVAKPFTTDQLLRAIDNGLVRSGRRRAVPGAGPG